MGRMSKTETTPHNPVLFTLCLCVLAATCIAAIDGILPFGSGWAKLITVAAFIGVVISYLKVWERANAR